ncbi:hypothetical protein FFF93_015825 [Arthrobacter sp. KBS0702]|uniref:hypothetical protein n=1 Tax=Arthrobacter sp. KBS0702 TaxID=2578107 RepID=UPI00110EAE17|nr:hypothetical protein [Arthrobacter sp. KBS0702]QDW31071.1 hypothetical protein FFF93_015825 [Arthrobacter sp. KBS0702]
MTPAINRPHPTMGSGAMRHGRPFTPARPLTAAPPLDTVPHPPLGRLDPHAAPVRTDEDYVGIPFCERCGTDEFVYLESFVPAKHRRDGSVSKLGEVAYFCSGCEDFSAHAVPASWVPPGWYLG